MKHCFSVRWKDQKKLERLILKHGIKDFRKILKMALNETKNKGGSL